jgi:hypothetical protein
MAEEFYHSRAGTAANRRAHSQWHNKEGIRIAALEERVLNIETLRPPH